jgi:hypothetical protein
MHQNTNDSKLIFEAYQSSSSVKDDHTVVVHINEKDYFESFCKFMDELSNLAAAGASREIGILDPSDDEERSITWSFDGDGSTRFEIEKS